MFDSRWIVKVKVCLVFSVSVQWLHAFKRCAKTFVSWLMENTCSSMCSSESLQITCLYDLQLTHSFWVFGSSWFWYSFYPRRETWVQDFISCCTIKFCHKKSHPTDLKDKLGNEWNLGLASRLQVFLHNWEKHLSLRGSCAKPDLKQKQKEHMGDWLAWRF